MGRRLAITPCQGDTEACVAHAIHHTSHTDFANCKFLHTGITTIRVEFLFLKEQIKGCIIIGGETEDEGL